MSQLGRVIKKLVFAALTGHYIFKLEKTPGSYFFFLSFNIFFLYYFYFGIIPKCFQYRTNWWEKNKEF